MCGMYQKGWHGWDRDQTIAAESAPARHGGGRDLVEIINDTNTFYLFTHFCIPRTPVTFVN